MQKTAGSSLKIFVTIVLPAGQHLDAGGSLMLGAVVYKQL